MAAGRENFIFFLCPLDGVRFNVEWLLYYTVPACESKKFSAYVGKTLIQSAAVFIFVVQSFIRDGICLKSKAPNRKQSEPSHFRVTFSTNSVQKKKRDSS